MPARTPAHVDEARRSAKCAYPADRLRNPHPSLCQLLPDALPGGPAADRSRIFVCVGDYALDFTARAGYLDCRPARRLLRRHAIHFSSGMRSLRLAYADHNPALHAGRVYRS